MVVPEDVQMPQVWHLPLEEAEAALDLAGIPYRISRARSREIPEGQLISAAPAPGTIMDSAIEAVLTVSHGPPTIRNQA
jgi:beta-lactam-binding protein with PASTA domain